MPRKKTVQPEPLERFYLPDGTEVEVINETCWPIGRGQHLACKFEYEKLNPIVDGLITKYMEPNGSVKVKLILSSVQNFINYISEEGLFGEDGSDDTNARKHWYKKINFRLNTYINAKNASP